MEYQAMLVFCHRCGWTFWLWKAQMRVLDFCIWKGIFILCVGKDQLALTRLSYFSRSAPHMRSVCLPCEHQSVMPQFSLLHFDSEQCGRAQYRLCYDDHLRSHASRHEDLTKKKTVSIVMGAIFRWVLPGHSNEFLISAPLWDKSAFKPP